MSRKHLIRFARLITVQAKTKLNFMLKQRNLCWSRAQIKILMCVLFYFFATFFFLCVEFIIGRGADELIDESALLWLLEEFK